MKYGVFQFSTDYAIRIEDLARETEARGFESLFVPEHTHIPANRKSPWPGGADLPREYWHTLDPFVSLAAAAAVTTKLKLGTGICLVIERDPITLAKEVASLDHLSRGRVLFGIGGGWNAEEMAHHGTDFASRFNVLRERIAAMQEIWTKDEAEYHGKFVSFDKLWSYPKPVQKPHPPILMGGAGPHARQRAADFGGHWLPIDAEPHSSANWISNVSITDILNAMSVQQLLVVADSCYAGTLTRSALGRLEPGMSDLERVRLMQLMTQKKSRMVMTSGGVEPVIDNVGGAHSVFAVSFIALLRANAGVLAGQEMFQLLRLNVTATADRVEMRQVPEYAPIKFGGHESGDFLFVRR